MQEEEKAKLGVRDLFTLPISNLDTSIFITIKKDVESTIKIIKTHF